MTSGERYERLAELFIEHQRTVLGDRATRLADGVGDVRVGEDGTVAIEGDGADAIGRLADEFRDLFGANVEESIRAAARELERPVEVPPSLARGRELRGFTEYEGDDDWQVLDELENIEPQPAVWNGLFGFGEGEAADREFDAAPIAAGRGIPLDASDPVHEAWIEQKRDRNGLKTATGHTWVTAGEIPDRILFEADDSLVSRLLAAENRYGPDRARLIVWLEYVV